MQESQDRLEKLAIKLREEGYRLTPQRMAVIKTLVGNREHLNAEQIYERVKMDFPMTSLATIYKTVSVLKEMDELLEISINGDSTHYDGASPHPHPHVVSLATRPSATAARRPGAPGGELRLSLGRGTHDAI